MLIMHKSALPEPGHSDWEGLVLIVEEFISFTSVRMHHRYKTKDNIMIILNKCIVDQGKVQIRITSPDYHLKMASFVHIRCIVNE